MAFRIHNCWTSFLKIYFYFCFFVTENISDFYQGDIKLDPELEDYIRNGGNSRNAIREKKRVWSTRIIPYYIPSHMSMYFRSTSSEENRDVKYLDCKTVLIFAYSGTREYSNKRSKTILKMESETGETLKIRLTRPTGEERLARFARVGLLRHALLILRKKETRLFCSPSISQFATLLFSYHVACHLTPSPPTPSAISFVLLYCSQPSGTSAQTAMKIPLLTWLLPRMRLAWPCNLINSACKLCNICRSTRS